jgi:hypothetical protein
VTAVWFTAGGFLDLRRMFRLLRGRTRDHLDDGFVHRDRSDERERMVREEASVEGGAPPGKAS